jgi:uncharacterized repeat protein (TIGR03803 family)
MRSSGELFHAYHINVKRMALNFFAVLLLVSSASLVFAQTIQTVFSFSFTNGANPEAALTLGNDGSFYGTTIGGGITNSASTKYASGAGTVFQVAADGTFTTLDFFSGTNGAFPSTLTLGSDGNFYGTTIVGGEWEKGTVFQVTTNGTLNTLVSFSGTNGAFPYAGLLRGSDGNFYGTTESGGTNNHGTVFQIGTNGVLATLYSFTGGNDGGYPYAGLVLGSDGSLYGTTYGGGTNGVGTVFQIGTNGSLTNLYSFTGGGDGAYPYAGLVQNSDGTFFGTTRGGGTKGAGTVFQIGTNGLLTTLFSFSGTNGANPEAALALGNDGNYYGTTYYGGASNSSHTSGMGTIFQLTTNGTLTTIVSFSGTNGANPEGALALGDDGNFYGTTYQGGFTNSGYPGGMGTAFRILLTPSITVQPQSQTNHAGENVTFSVAATSIYPAMGYQWQKNGTNLVDGGRIMGSTNDALTITDVSDGDVASYSVVLSDVEGSVSSSNATLTVDDAVSFYAQPSSQTVGVGGGVTFSAVVYGAPPFVFQWSFNQAPIDSPTTGTNVSSITLTNVGTNQSGNYTVQVFNGLGSATSSNAVLTVISQPTLGLEILVGYPTLSLYGTPGYGFVVQCKTNLADSAWTTLLSLTNLSSSPYQFLDPAGIGQPARFYRAFLLP